MTTNTTIFNSIDEDDMLEMFTMLTKLGVEGAIVSSGYQCSAYSNLRYMKLGWREPCYLLGDRHAQDVNDLFSEDLCERYGVCKDPRCTNCLMDCGFESASIYQAVDHPLDAIKMIRKGALQNSGLGGS